MRVRLPIARFKTAISSVAAASFKVTILFATLLALIAGGCSFKGERGKAQQAAASDSRKARVRVATAQTRQVSRTVEAVGSLFPYEEVTVSSEVEGKVDRVFVDVGDSVAEGQMLVKVSPIELQYELDQQIAALRQARARLGLTEDDDELKRVEDAAEVKKAAAELDEAEQKYRRADDLFKHALISRQELDEAEARYKSARATYEATVHQVENLLASIQQYQAAVQLARKRLADTDIRAPFSGFIKERLVAPGQYLRVQTPVAVIVNTNPLRCRLNVPEKMAPWIKVGQNVQIATEAYPGQTFSGRVWRLKPSVDETTRTFGLEALIENSRGLLKPGFFVKARIATDKVDSTLTIPLEATIYSYGIYKVLVVENGRLREREISIGDRIDGQVEVVSGLKLGEQVALLESNLALKDGMEVEIR